MHTIGVNSVPIQQTIYHFLPYLQPLLAQICFIKKLIP
jgi:hypothetical protein